MSATIEEKRSGENGLRSGRGVKESFRKNKWDVEIAGPGQNDESVASASIWRTHAGPPPIHSLPRARRRGRHDPTAVLPELRHSQATTVIVEVGDAHQSDPLLAPLDLHHAVAPPPSLPFPAVSAPTTLFGTAKAMQMVTACIRRVYEERVAVQDASTSRTSMGNARPWSASTRKGKNDPRVAGRRGRRRVDPAHFTYSFSPPPTIASSPRRTPALSSTASTPDNFLSFLDEERYSGRRERTRRSRRWKPPRITSSTARRYTRAIKTQLMRRKERGRGADGNDRGRDGDVLRPVAHCATLCRVERHEKRIGGDIIHAEWENSKRTSKVSIEDDDVGGV
ncbi:hypothetical protein R3P38DRAFT_2795385 [Favolaschia claudopus]|uniref:Uncharacterized protein n=1 Tax=Favolaschia claudopus TaxID=2862362 RepID=A0AAW0A8B4_9AGAR